MMNKGEQPQAMETYKKQILESFNWVKKNSSKGGVYAASKADVSINMIKHGEGKVALFVLRNKTGEIIAPNFGRVQLGVKESRVYFLEDKDGFKLSTSKGVAKNKYIRPSAKGVFEEFEGDYKLKHDDFLSLYYIEKEG